MEIGGLSMKSDFQMMTMGELKKYVLEHRNDQEAFQWIVLILNLKIKSMER